MGDWIDSCDECGSEEKVCICELERLKSQDSVLWAELRRLASMVGKDLEVCFRYENGEFVGVKFYCPLSRQTDSTS